VVGKIERLHGVFPASGGAGFHAQGRLLAADAPIGAANVLDAKVIAADANIVPAAQPLPGAADASPVHFRAVGTAQIANNPTLVGVDDFGMEPAHQIVVQNDIQLSHPTDAQVTVGTPLSLTRCGPDYDDQ